MHAKVYYKSLGALSALRIKFATGRTFSACINVLTFMRSAIFIHSCSTSGLRSILDLVHRAPTLHVVLK